MPLTLNDGASFDLRFFWETAPEGEPLSLRDRAAAIACVRRFRSLPGAGARLRRFFAEGSWMAAVHDERALWDQLAVAIETGRILVSRRRPLPLTTWGDVEEEAPSVPLVERPAEPPPPEEICWPCLRARASAQALRIAASQGAPFIAQD